MHRTDSGRLRQSMGERPKSRESGVDNPPPDAAAVGALRICYKADFCAADAVVEVRRTPRRHLSRPDRHSAGVKRLCGYAIRLGPESAVGISGLRGGRCPLAWVALP